MQELVHNAYYQGHGFKWQSLISPCGIFEDFYGPETGRHHDKWLWDNSGLERTFADLPTLDGKRYYIYGDAAYVGESVDNCVMIGYGYGTNMTPEQEHFTKSMNKVRTCVEWGFRVINQTWASLGRKDFQKIRKTKVGNWYLLAVILTNVRTCVNGVNQISAYFDCPPPSLPEYLAAPRPELVRPYARMRPFE